ncbi:hypothetical protein M9Y10_013523 [Tritrichomonas musculus]|uniref:HTH cro/C1-type domain-containing protein n=1 Tax=Tritrichomonas musculus TaxID=1915356 RepID=A0ABR2GMZ7_9EUKA
MFKKNLISERLRKSREMKNLTRPQVQEKTGIPLSTLTDWELKRNLPRLDKAGILAELYGVSVDYILGRTDNPEVNKSFKCDK